MRFVWLLVALFPWSGAASYISKQTIHQSRKYSSKEDFMRRLLGFPGEEEILMERIGAAVTRVLATKRDRVMENVASKSEMSNVIVNDRMRRHVDQVDIRRRQVDQEDIRRALCRAATVGEFFRLVAGPVNCRDVVACTDDGLWALRCPPGLAFSLKKQTCDWQADVTDCHLKSKLS